MKPIEYLRAKARARKPATGGTITAEQAAQVAALFAQANDRPCHMRTEFRSPTADATSPAFLLEIKDTPTQAEVEQLRQQLQITARPKPRPRSAPILCPCIAIYSDCHCHLRKKT